METINFKQAAEELKKKNMIRTKLIGQTSQKLCYDYESCFLRTLNKESCFHQEYFLDCPKRKELLKTNLIKANIPKRFLSCTFEEIIKRGIPEELKEQTKQIIKFYCEDFENKIKDGKGLILKGSVGTMKTTFAVAILNFWIDGFCGGGMFVNMSSLLDSIFTLKAASPEDWARYENKIKKTSLLVLDDLGAEHTEGWVLTKVDAIISERYNNCLSTIITTNLSAEALTKTYARRVIDRLSSTCEIINFDGKSLREKQGA